MGSSGLVLRILVVFAYVAACCAFGFSFGSKDPPTTVSPLRRAPPPPPPAPTSPARIDSQPHYTFRYVVQDARTGDYKTQEERRDGGKVRGTYSVTEPNGDLRVVSYSSDNEGGFRAEVRVEPGGAVIVPDVPEDSGRTFSSFFPDPFKLFRSQPVYSGSPQEVSASPLTLMPIFSQQQFAPHAQFAGQPQPQFNQQPKFAARPQQQFPPQPQQQFVANQPQFQFAPQPQYAQQQQQQQKFAPQPTQPQQQFVAHQPQVQFAPAQPQQQFALQPQQPFSTQQQFAPKIQQPQRPQFYYPSTQLPDAFDRTAGPTVAAPTPVAFKPDPFPRQPETPAIPITPSPPVLEHHGDIITASFKQQLQQPQKPVFPGNFQMFRRPVTPVLQPRPTTPTKLATPATTPFLFSPSTMMTSSPYVLQRQPTPMSFMKYNPVPPMVYPQRPQQSMWNPYDAAALGGTPFMLVRTYIVPVPGAMNPTPVVPSATIEPQHEVQPIRPEPTVPEKITTVVEEVTTEEKEAQPTIVTSA